jgi:glyoxylase-like metal-dependent hydrolase (beta-lactamase superfamily II)
MTAASEHRETFPRTLCDGIWALGNYFFNLYLVRGETASALIEVGVSGVTDEVIRQLEALGTKPTFLVVTHPHADHVTGLDGLRARFPDALAVAGQGAPEFLSHRKTAEAVIQEDRHISAFLEKHGFPPGRPPVSEPPSLSNCLLASNGDEMDLGGITLRFLSAKGHSIGAVSVYVPEREPLLVSDALGFRFPGRGVFPLFNKKYLDSPPPLYQIRRL